MFWVFHSNGLDFVSLLEKYIPTYFADYFYLNIYFIRLYLWTTIIYKIFYTRTKIISVFILYLSLPSLQNLCRPSSYHTFGMHWPLLHLNCVSEQVRLWKNNNIYILYRSIFNIIILNIFIKNLNFHEFTHCFSRHKLC